MSLELNLSFPTIDQVTVSLHNQTTVTMPFAVPLTAADWQDMQWYLEIYPNQYATDVDDHRADRVVAKLKVWGQLLFNAVFKDLEAARLFHTFQAAEGEEKQISIAASQPEILQLPWELLCDVNGEFLLHQTPQITLLRQFSGESRRIPIAIEPKEQLRLLMIVSRPHGTGFIDPRSDSQATMRAVEHHAPGRIVIEFLRPATLSKLVERLNNSELPAIDIVHFDGHGFLDQSPENRYGWEAATEQVSMVHNQLPVTAKSSVVLTRPNPKLQTSYLLFEDENGNQNPISARILGDVFHQQQISLIVLSACQSGTITGEDALGCAAALLTYQGIPAVLAMTYAVLVTTTEQFFGKFYGELAQGKSLGTSLATARRDLAQHNQRGLRWRGTEQINLELADWFLPTWYQVGKDMILLKNSPILPANIKPSSGMINSFTKEGFFGRSRELWLIEKAFIQGTRRLAITGFAGQGKTCLAIESGQWLYQTGMFDAVCFIRASHFSGVNSLESMISELSMVLGQCLSQDKAIKEILEQKRTLIILDGLDELSPNSALPQLLTAAKVLSEIGETCLLLTARHGDFHHSDYCSSQENLEYQQFLLQGLNPEDAVHYFQKLIELLPVSRSDFLNQTDLLKLLQMLDFHTLSIELVAAQLRDKNISDLSRDLELLLKTESSQQYDLVNSINLSLEQLSLNVLEFLPELAAFQGGAWESQILKITNSTTNQWQKVRSELEKLELVQVNIFDSTKAPFIRFHPVLTPLLWKQLSSIAKADLRTKHYQQYYALSIYLDNADNYNPHEIRLIARQELPNLLWAVKNAIADKFEDAVDFVDRVNKFLDIFGLQEDRALLTANLEELIGAVGSQDWYLVRSNQGKQLYNAGQYEAAAQLFTEILQELDTTPSFDRVNTLNYLSRCLRTLGVLPQAEECLRTGLSLSEQLEQSEEVKRQRGNLQADLGNILKDLGQYESAQQAYQDSLAIKKEIGDRRGAAVTKGQLGTLAMLQNDLVTATQQYQSALQTFQQLQEPQMEAVAWHQLGMVYEEDKQWAAADRTYRTSARIQEQQGNFTGAASTYNQLAILNERMNQSTEAEAWYLKALQIARTAGDRLGESKRLHNLANLLANQSDRLSAAQQIAEEALAIDQTLDPAAAATWKTYDLLAKIATAQGKISSAQAYRQQARSAKAAFAGTQYELQQHEPLIITVVTAVADQSTAEQLETLLTKRNENGWGQLVAAIRCILAGERLIEALWDDLDADDSMIIQAIIDRLS